MGVDLAAELLGVPVQVGRQADMAWGDGGEARAACGERAGVSSFSDEAE